MKNHLIPILLLLAFPGLAQALPRITVSTPSLLPESEVDVVFEQPMVGDESLGKEVPNDLIEIKPRLASKLFWKAPTIAELKLEETPAIGTAYRFIVKGSPRHTDGTPVGKGEIAKVSTEDFRIHTARVQNRWSREYSPATASWLIVFNDDVDPAAIAGFFGFSSGSNQRVAADLRHATAAEAGYFRTNYLTWANRANPDQQRAEVSTDSPVGNIVMVTPNSPLPPGKKWELRLLKGLPNAGKSTTLGSEQSYNIGTVEPFMLKGVAARVSVDSPRSIVISFNRKLPEKVADGLVSVSPVPDDMAVEVDGSQLRIRGDFEKSDRYSVNVRKELVSAENEALGSATTKEVEFERIFPQIALPSESEGQFAHGQRKYSISTTNLSKLNIRIKMLEGKGAVRAIQGYRNYTGRGPDYSDVEPRSVIPYSLIPGETVVEKEIDLATGVDSGKTLDLLWDDLLPEGSKHATFFLDVIGTPHPGARADGRRNAQAIIQLTDIGLAWKFSDESALLFAFSCETGKPLAGVELRVFGEDASLMETVVTDESGLANVPRGKKARHLQAISGKDSYAVAFDETLDQVGMWHFPVRYSWMKSLPETRRAMMFTDRSLYRPGEKVRIKGIVRDQIGNAIALSKQAPARVVILDPQEKEIFDREITISALGSFDLEYVLPASKTGDHTIRLEFPEDLRVAEETEDWERQIALQQSASFSLPLKVEEFRRNTFEIVQKIDTPEPGADEVKAKLTATYYQGQPVAAGKASVFTEITDVNPYPERYRDFLFGNHRADDWRYWYHYFGYRDRDGDNGITSTSFDSEMVLSNEGFAEIPVKVPSGDFPVGKQVGIATEVTDANDQTLTARSQTVVHPSSIYAGISRVDRLIRVGDEAPFRVVAVTTEGEPARSDIAMTATLTRQVHTTTKTSNENGDTVTRSDPHEENVFTKEITIPASESAKEGLSFPVTPSNTGLHFLTLKGTDSDGRAFATVTRFHVYGAKEYPWQYEDGMRIKLVSEKKSYQPGDVARVLVLSPIEGTALVTVEREKILSSYLTRISADNPVIEIPLSDDHAPNAYVSVLIVKGSAESAREIKEPQLRLGYCELTVENQRDRLEVAIEEPADSYRPGTAVTLVGNVKSADGKPAAGSEVTLYAVDEGTLAVMGYDTPDPMAHFYDPRRLSIDAGTSFHTFLSENTDYRSFHNKGFIVGGGGDLSKLADLLRKNFDPCAAWAPTLVTDENGGFSHTFNLPDTLTRYRVVAVAHHGGAKFGNAESAVVVKKPLMLEPKLPRFAHQGDGIVSQVMVQNASGRAATWEVACAVSTGEGTPRASLEGPASQSVTLGDGESSVLTFPLRINDTGEVSVSFRAAPLSLQNGDLTPELSASLSDAVEETFVSHFPMPLLRQVESLRVTANSTADLRDLLSKELATATGTVELDLATSPLVEISSSVEYLLQYPYGCAEQTSSSLIPWFAVKNLRPYVPAFARKTDVEIDDAIRAGIGRLLSMQHPNGSFGYWPGDPNTNDWVTPYAGMALVLASKHGGNVPEASLQNLGQYLIASLRGAGESKNSAHLENHARALYTLALLGKPQAPYHALMAEKLPFMSPNARAMLAAAVATSAEGRPEVLSVARQILGSKVPYKPSENRNYWTPGNASMASELLAWTAVDPDSEQVDKALDRLLGERNPYGHWRSTWLNGWSLLAISNYAGNHAMRDEPIKIVLHDDSGQREITLTKENPCASVSLPLGPATAMRLDSSAAAFVRVNVSGKPVIAPMAPVAKNGLTIERTYEKVLPSGQTEVLKQPSKGDLIRVTLQVTLPEDDTRYLVVDDPLPSVFETVNSEFSSQASAQRIRTSENDWNISHSELRSDRAVFFMNHIWRKGTYKVTYLARCTMAGDVHCPPAKVESMYDPENFALSASRKFSAK